MARGTKGIYHILNREKYVYPNVSTLIYRSKWECRFLHWVDRNPNVVRWGYEVIQIPYVWSVDGKCHRYFPDLYLEFKANDNSDILKVVVEIKPSKEAKLGKTLYENLTYSKNYDKWNAAKKFCDEHGYKFVVITENELFKRLSK